MTIQDIINGIASAIYTEFGSAYKIYCEKVEQDLDTPCFLLKCLNPSHNRELGVRYGRKHPMVVQYIAQADGNHAECNTVFTRLSDCLQDITVGGKTIHGTGMESDTTNGILTITVNYDVMLLESSVPTNMGVLSVTTGAK